ncbi:MAG: HEAT repeat domain-containing protein, partial [Gemmataceae bacterium]|nr:HEAT repeat domain-containing protein [Gemmataceae bacterium]
TLMKNIFSALVITIALSLIFGGQQAFAQPKNPVPPDLTKDKPADIKLTYNLGATGLRGWIYTKPANFFESQQGRTTTFSRQILVTHVGAKSPADGVIKINDVILGVDGKPFADDARKSIALAIADAEKETNQGKLTLLVWRQGKTEKVQLKLRVMGSYSATAPFNCPKSKLIFDEACKVLENEPLRDDMWGAVNGLALMATGNPEYLPRVKALAHKIGPKTLKLELKDGMFMWDWGYRNVFLCEYYLLTGDKDVLPAINEYAISLAKGQSMYGTFGHGIAKLTPDGQLHGSIPPYGPVNAAGLIANMAIVMGKNCGVKHPEIEPAVDRASKFFGYFVDKGAIPYGEHMPWPNHENNGKNAMTALLFGLQGNRIRETQFWAKMVTASYQNREYGHTGQGFSYLWGALGANTGGPDALAAYFNQASWHFDLVRRSDGSFTYDGGEQFGPGKTDDNTYYGKSSYYGLSPCATYVLTYSIPLKKIALTGRGVDQASWLTKKEVADAIASGRFDLDRKNKTNEELIEAMGDWSPVVRSWAAEELGKRPERKELVPRLIALAEGPDYRKRQGAAETLGYINSAEALPVLVRLLTHEDRWLRVKAANALRNMGDTAKPVVPEMLKAVVVTAEPLAPIVWDDPIQLTHGELAAALFRGLLRTSIKGIDPELLYPAIRAISKNADGMARAQLTHTITNQLTLEDVQALAPDILLAIDIPSPADTMFANEIRMAGLRALSKYNFREGIRVSLKFAQTQSPHGSEKRMGEIMKELLRYGSAAKEVLPDLKVLIIQCQEEKDFPDWAKKMKIVSVEEAIKAIESTSTQPELRTIQAPKSAPKK